MKIFGRLRLSLKRKKGKSSNFMSGIDIRQNEKSRYSNQTTASQQFDINLQIENETAFRNEFASAIEPLFNEDFELAYKLCIEFWLNIENQPMQQMSESEFKTRLSDMLIDYNRWIKFADFLLRDRRIPESVQKQITVVFLKGYSPHYVIRTGSITRIVVSLSPEDAHAQKQNLMDIYGRSVSSSSAYLDRALDHLRNNSYLDSIRESINALENSVCTLDQDGNNQTLSQSLKSLKKGDIFNNEYLLSWVKSLWDFANNTPGIRHGNQDPSQFVATADQAHLIFSLVSAWCAYLDKQNPAQT